MVNPSTDSYTTLQTAAENKYTDSVPAAGLFWKRYTGRYVYGLRIEAPAIMKEFSDGVPFGADPEGTLFFYNIDDLEVSDTTTKFNLFHNCFTDDRRAVVVQIYQDDPTKPYAEFIAKDPNQTVDYTISAKSGTWANINQGSANAHVVKNSTNKTVTVTISAIKKKATFDITRKTDLDNNISVNVWGSIMFKDISQLKNGSYVNYNKDRLIFYPTPSGTVGTPDFVAAFFPVETAPVGALGNFTNDNTLDSFELSGVKWFDT